MGNPPWRKWRRMARILFVDDDGLGLRLMARLCSLLGYQALVNLSAIDALAVARRERPDLILVDLRMAEMDGLEFVRQIRCASETAQIPVLIYSAGTGDLDEKQALEA